MGRVDFQWSAISVGDKLMKTYIALGYLLCSVWFAAPIFAGPTCLGGAEKQTFLQRQIEQGEDIRSAVIEMKTDLQSMADENYPECEEFFCSYYAEALTQCH